MIQQERHIFKGIQRDLSVSKFNAEFAYDAYNIRLTARDNNTLLSATNEKGTLEIPIEWKDKDIININDYNILGYAVLNEYLVLFIQYIELEIYHDAIVRLELNNAKDKFNGVILFDQTGDKNTGALNFNIKNPIESLPIYESKDVQKIYWVDGINPVRVINISDLNKIKSYNNFSFDFLQELQLKEEVNITVNKEISGQFPCGTVQYAFTYYNKYGSESNIVYTSPIYYTYMTDRAGSPEEKALGGFNIEIFNLDTKFDYLRLYSILRTSENGTPIVKVIKDINIKENTYTKYIKDQLQQESIRYNYDDKHTITDVLNIKDLFNNTLFLKDLQIKNISNPDDIGGVYTEYIIPKGYTISFKEFHPSGDIIYSNYISGDNTIIKIYSTNRYNDGHIQALNYYSTSGESEQILPVKLTDNNTIGSVVDSQLLLYIGGKDIRPYTITQKDNTLFLGNIKFKDVVLEDNIKDNIRSNSTVSFKYRNTEIQDSANSNYPYQIQLNKSSRDLKHFKGGEVYRIGVQFKDTKGNYTQPVWLGDYKNNLYPTQNKLPYIEATLKNPNITDFYKARLVMAEVQNKDRSIIAQGILCPTVFNASDRYDNSPFAQASWFIRPFGTIKAPVNIASDNYAPIHQELQIDKADNDNKIYITKGSTISTVSYTLTYIKIGFEDSTVYRVDLFNDKKEIVYANASTSYNKVIGGLKNYIDANYIPSKDDFKFTSQSTEIKAIEEPENIYDISNLTYKYYSDTSIITMHSPDINLNQTTINNAKLRIIGYTILDYITTDYNVNSTLGKAQDSKVINTNFSGKYKSGFFTMKPIYQDQTKDSEIYTRYFIYPWQRNGSLNSEGAVENRKALLKTKIISNLSYYDNATMFNTPWESYLEGDEIRTGITNVRLFNSDSVTALMLDYPKNASYKDQNLIYYGNIDKIVTPDKDGYLIKYIGTDNPQFNYDNYKVLEEPNTKTYDPISMKYKSTPHYVFSLNFTNDGIQRELPKLYQEGDRLSRGIANIPIWNTIPVIKEPDYTAETLEALTKPTKEGQIAVTTNDMKVYGVTKIVSPESTISYKWGPFNIFYSIFKVDNILYIIDKNKTDYSLIRYQYSKSEYIKVDKTPNNNYLYIAELYKDVPESVLYGGNSKEAINNNTWIPIGNDVDIRNQDNITLIGTEGDTYYQRYDCLKTYAYTQEDQNQLIDTVSFMVETHQNLDGRYDKNRNNISNLYINPTNFNLFNSVYNQDNNYFNYHILDDRFKQTNFPNTITWTKEKHILSDIDEWTNITMASTLDLDGDKGQVTSLNTFNNEIFCFQEKGFSNILFNSRVQIPASDGVPIEITNGLKVQGKRYISNMVGCQNKWSIVETPSGLYFMDNNTSSIYQFNGQINSLTDKLGFKSWMNEVNNYSVWNPIDYSNFKSFYDKGNDDIYFINKDYCLCYSEYLQQFTSFMSYESVPLMVNIDSELYSFKKGKLWQNNAGEYNMFYNEFKPYSITFISNDNPSYDKIFNNLDFRADSFDNNTITNKTFDTLEVWNEYQKGITKLNNIVGRPSNLKKKFRIWRVNIPRANTDWNGIVANNRDRIRNTWAYIKLSMNDSNNKLKTQLHDVIVSYFM